MINERPPATYQEYFRSLTILHAAMLVGQALFAAVAAFLVFSKTLPPSFENDGVLQAIVLLVVIGSMVGGPLLYKQIIAKARFEVDIDQQLARYRTAIIARNAVEEAGTLILIIISLLTGSPVCLFLAAAGIVSFAAQFPTRQRVLEALGLDELSFKEKEIEEHP